MTTDPEAALRWTIKQVRYAHALLIEDLAELVGIPASRLLAFETGRPGDFTPEEAMNLHGVLTAMRPEPGQRRLPLV